MRNELIYEGGKSIICTRRTRRSLQNRDHAHDRRETRCTGRRCGLVTATATTATLLYEAFSFRITSPCLPVSSETMLLSSGCRQGLVLGETHVDHHGDS